MEFYIKNKNGNWDQVYVEVQPKLSKAFDTTNDSFSCVLQANTDDVPYAPMTLFKIIDDANATTLMWIVNDNVSVFSMSPLSYKHELSLVQYRYFLNKHLIRNTNFNQPRKKAYKLYGAATNYAEFVEGGVYDFQAVSQDAETVMWTDTLPLGSKTKVKSGSYIIKLYGTTIINTSARTQEITSLTDEDFIRIKSTAKFYIYRADTNTILVDNLYISNFGKHIVLTSSQIAALNVYADLKVGIYGSGNTDDWERAFVESTDRSQLNPSYQNITAQLHVSLELYNYTMYDVIDELLKQYRLSYGVSQSKRPQLFNLPASGELYDLLKSTYPPDTITFTQTNFYDALSEIFRFYDAGFKFDENGTIDIEYYNNSANQRNVSKTGVSLTFNDKNYQNSRVAYYQNAVQDIKLRKIPTRTQNLGVPAKSDYGILLPYPIYDVTKVEYICSCSGTLPFTPSVADNNKFNIPSDIGIDISYFLLNENEWTNLPKTSGISGSIYSLKQISTFYFQRGSKFIQTSDYYQNWHTVNINKLETVIRGSMARFFGFNAYSGVHGFQTPTTTPAVTNYQNQFFNIEYLTENNGRVVTETINNKYAGELLNNQASGGVDLSKLGLNMLGESLKDGEPTLSASLTITDWANRIVEGDYIIYNGDKWVANVVNYTALGDGKYECAVQFSKNFNLLSMRVKTDKEKRLTAISNDLATMSEDNFTDYVYVTDITKGPTRTDIVLGGAVLESMIGQTFGITNYDIKDVSFGLVSTSVNGVSIESNLFIPILKYGAGNCVCFEMQYDNPMNAGNQLGYNAAWFWQDGYFTQACLYTDREGWADKFTIDFVDPLDAYYDFLPNTKFPKIDKSYGGIDLLNIVGTLSNLEYHKKPNEIFALNYEWCFLPLPTEIHDFFIGSAFINNNFFANKNAAQGKKFYLYYTLANQHHKYLILDKKGVIGDGLTRKEISFATKQGSYYVALYIMTTSHLYASGSWSICDENGDIYFASNNAHSFENDIDETDGIIYFMTKNERMKDDDALSNLPEPYTPSGTKTFKVSPNQWLQIPAVWAVNIDYSGTPDSFVHDDDRTIASWTYNSTEFTRVPAGTTLLPLSMKSGYPLYEGKDGTIVSSGSYTTVTSGNNRFWEFSVTLTLNDWHTGDHFKGTIYWAYSTSVVDKWLYDYAVTIPELVGANVTNISISPSSEVLGNMTVDNTISFNRTNGTFSGKVYKASQPSTDVTYTITYTVS